jgi:hypothetical protein
MDRPLAVLRTLVVALALMLIAHSLVRTSRNVQLFFLIAFLFVAASLGLYAYARPRRVAAIYAKDSKVSLWLSGGVAYSTPEKAKRAGLALALLCLIATALVLLLR